MTELIKDFYGRVIAKVETDSKGNKTLKDFYGKILGYYDVQRNETLDFYRRVIGRGDCLTSLIPHDN